MIWVVQGPSGSKIDPALLQQTYSVARAGSGAGETAGTLTGERNTEITLHSESADSGPSGLLVTVMQLKILAVPA